MSRERVHKAFIVGLQEALFETHGEMALALNRVAGRAMMEYIEDEELLEITGNTANSLAHDVKKIIESLGDVGDVLVEEGEDTIELIIVECPFSDVKRELLDRDKVPVVCPFASLVLKATEETFGVKMRIVSIDVDDEECRFVMERTE
ncbi:hypothetical protein [Methanopyrus sp. KOL6]|uniref:hypothetical protein n=1 Tax=Methanopyrus sp. KOL6 TaxID=1937004 RepID=UPI000B4BA6CB|nr:hypothetical protein [Methanopyrus sp. KOL6]